MHRTTHWRRKRKAAIEADSPIGNGVKKRGPKEVDGLWNVEWRAFAGAVLANLLRHGRVVHGMLKENRKHDWPEILLHYVEPPTHVTTALTNSKISPCSLAFAAAEFGRVTVRSGRLDQMKPRRESSTATYWKSIPGFTKELAAYCRNRAPKRKAAADLIHKLSKLESRPLHTRENETHRWEAKETHHWKDLRTPPSLLAPNIQDLLSPESLKQVDLELNHFFTRHVHGKSDLPALYKFGKKLILEAILQAPSQGLEPQDKTISFRANSQDEEAQSGNIWATVGKWDHADEIDRRLGLKDR